MKKEYMKPSLKEVKMDHKCQILAGSGDPMRNAPWWDREAGANRFNDVWDEDWEDE